MHIQIINFGITGITEQEYVGMCESQAPAFAGLPGLVSKTWLANRDTRTYGGVYVWEDREAMERFTKTDLFNAVATHPNLENVRSVDFDVLDAPTRVTRGLAEARV